MIPLAAFALSGCLALSPAADYIRARDLAAPLPAWSAIAPETAVIPAPIPGIPRVLLTGELHRLARRWNVDADASNNLCFAIPVSPPDAARVLEAMRRQLPGARIEILEISRQPAPEGQLEFPLSGLHLAPGGGQWNGYVSYGARGRFAVWARVKVAVEIKRVVAARDLPVGHTLEAGDLRVETQDAAPGAGPFLADIAEAAGRIPRRSIPSGAPLRPELLDAPKEVRRGDTVQVEVIQGGAHLKLEAVAQTSGAIGETIRVENPTSKRLFRARVQAKGKVVVDGTL
jgi:flagella basal body P-ring formation protein FlgA